MRVTVTVCVLALSMLATTASALDAAEKCEASKLKVAGKYEFCRLKAEARAVKTGAAPDFAKCDEKYATKWTQAEAGGSCPTTGDQATQQTELRINANRTACQLSGQPRFVDNADGSITDHQTCLVWEKKTEKDGTVNVANPHDADRIYRWAGTCSVVPNLCQPTPVAAALCAANAENGTLGCAECAGGNGTCDAAITIWTVAADLNAASFAGHTDWRLPTRTELLSIVDYADTTSSPVVDVAFDGV